MDTKKLRRAGLDYRDLTVVQEHKSWEHFLEEQGTNRIFAFSTKAEKTYSDISYQAGDIFLFGPETRGLPEDLMSKLPKEQLLRLPMLASSRSLNLSNTVAIATYEALRQTNFSGLE